MEEFGRYRDFFPYYVAQHSRAATRWMHFAGTHLGLAVALTGVVTRRPRLLPLFPILPVVSYSFAWSSHFLIERNRPATFGHPLWSLRGDLEMLGYMWRGRDAALGRMARAVLAAAAGTVDVEATGHETVREPVAAEMSPAR